MEPAELQVVLTLQRPRDFGSPNLAEEAMRQANGRQSGPA